MQETSDLYKELLASEHTMETRLAIGESGTLITRQGDVITFGGICISLGEQGPASGYGENMLISIDTKTEVFGTGTPTVGSCVSATINAKMLKPYGEIPKQARLVPYIRLTDGTRYSEWIQKGVFYLDTRDEEDSGLAIEKLVLTGFDAMLKAEQDYPASTLSWPAKDIDVVKEIATFIGVDVDSRTVSLINKGYKLQLPTEYSCREVLGYIAAMYAGCFVMNDIGELRLVTLYGIPLETNYLITKANQAITFCGVRILV